MSLAQPTISGQLALFEKAIGSKLFKREGRKLHLNEQGWVVFNYADEIFSIGDDLKSWLRGASTERRRNLKISICESVDTQVALHLLSPALNAPQPPKLFCVSSDAERLLLELRLRTYDLAILTAPPARSDHNSTFSRPLATLEIALFGPAARFKKRSKDFPRSLHRAPFVLPIQSSALRRSLDHWFETQGIEPDIKAEVGDSELRKSVAAIFEGFIFAPTIAREEIRLRYGLEWIEAIRGVEEKIFAVTNERNVKNPSIVQIIESSESR